ncbi:DUF3784 domain-containing protein [Metabacillus sp. 113a]|uniref:DUF3784 domain-containing protein n=1 Tax=Metabacillus sp. 113a TaxID=3404706 RepID=UPI003CF064E9
MGIAIVMIMIPFFIFAAVLSKGKGAFLIAGYYTMSESEKAQYDEAALCRFMGKVMYSVSFCLALMALGEMLEMDALLGAGVILLTALIIFLFVYSNTSNRFKRTH